jgi:hypothetical protein
VRAREAGETSLCGHRARFPRPSPAFQQTNGSDLRIYWPLRGPNGRVVALTGLLETMVSRKMVSSNDIR